MNEHYKMKELRRIMRDRASAEMPGNNTLVVEQEAEQRARTLHERLLGILAERSRPPTPVKADAGEQEALPSSIPSTSAPPPPHHQPAITMSPFNPCHNGWRSNGNRMPTTPADDPFVGRSNSGGVGSLQYPQFLHSSTVPATQTSAPSSFVPRPTTTTMPPPQYGNDQQAQMTAQTSAAMPQYQYPPGNNSHVQGAPANVLRHANVPNQILQTQAQAMEYGLSPGNQSARGPANVINQPAQTVPSTMPAPLQDPGQQQPITFETAYPNGQNVPAKTLQEAANRAKYEFVILNQMHQTRKEQSNLHDLNYLQQGTTCAIVGQELISMSTQIARAMKGMKTFDQNPHTDATYPTMIQFTQRASQIIRTALPTINGLAHGVASRAEDPVYKWMMPITIKTSLFNALCGFKGRLMTYDRLRHDFGHHVAGQPTLEEVFGLTRRDFWLALAPEEDDSIMGQYDYVWHDGERRMLGMALATDPVFDLGDFGDFDPAPANNNPST